ncbi:hypothetical protein [Demetria terragena]|uniref:hypothetical protein n=1 Tax=Demetria terragena TaxID=63959 RepID=UPI000362A7B8|nr:hypothetical protein [Demetria terragena]
MPKPSAAATLPGLLLSRAAPSKVSSWLGRGTVPGYVVPLGGWTAVVPAGQSLAAAPYDEAIPVLSARPVPGPLRPMIAFAVMDQPEKAVVVVRPKAGPKSDRWLAWAPDQGAMELPGYASANVRDLLAAAGLDESERGSVLALLGRREGTCRQTLIDVVTALGLPGAEFLGGAGAATKEDAVLVTPERRRVDRFDRDIQEAREINRDLGREPRP